MGWLFRYFPAMQLRTYLRRNRISATQFAKSVGKSKSLLTLVLQGKRRVSPALAKEIERVTNGDVPKHEMRADIWDKPRAA